MSYLTQDEACGFNAIKFTIGLEFQPKSKNSNNYTAIEL
jgi:hypothetical protein